MELNVKKIFQKRQTPRFVAHIIVIMMVFVLPDVIMALTLPHRVDWMWGFYLKSAVYIAVFYVNFLFVIDRTLGARKVNILKFIVYNLVIIATALVIIYFVSKGLTPSRPHRGHAMHEPTVWQQVGRTFSILLRDIVMMVLSIALAVALKLSVRWREIERRSREITAIQQATELENLKNQLNPHFLFNTLNSIYALIAINPDTAQSAVHRLSQLLRYVLYENPRWVGTNQELEFITNYVELMRLRLPADTLKLTLPDHLPTDSQLPPMIFVSLIENAIKHGNTGSSDKPVTIDISVDEAADTITYSSTNYYDPSTRLDSSSGIGVANLRRRLQIIYGSAAHYSTHVSDNRYTATLTLPLHHTNQAD